MKKTIRLSESELHRVIKESVKRILKENSKRRKKIREGRGNNPYGKMAFNQEAFEEWENKTHIDSEVMEMAKHIAEKIGMGDLEEQTVELKNYYGDTMGYGKGFVISHCTSSYADGPSTDYSKQFLKWCKGLGFKVASEYGDNGMDSATNWHDTYWTVEVVYGPTITYDTFTRFEGNEEDYEDFLEYDDEHRFDDDEY